MSDRSPGVYITELDLSDYIQTVSGTIFAVLGGATKGPMNDPTEVFSEEDLIQKFGTPQLGNYGYAMHSMIQYLREGRRGVFVRVSDNTDAVASVQFCDTGVDYTGPTPVVEEDPSIVGYGTVLGQFESASPGTWGNNIRVIISDVAEDPNFAGDTVFNLEVQVPADIQVPVQNWYTVEAWNYTQLELRLSTNPASERWYEQVINEGIDGEKAASRYIVATALAQPGWPIPTATGTTIFPGRYTLGSQVFTTSVSTDSTFVPLLNLVLGADGVSGLSDADYIGTYVGQTATGLKVFANAERTDINILAVPGISSAPVILEALSICSTRGDCMMLVDSPFGLDDAGVIDWHDGNGYAHSAFNDSYGALYWSWIEAYDQYSKRSVWMPPCGFVAARYAYTDRIRGSHWAPAGIRRGKISLGIQLEQSPDPGQRDALYTGGNCVNPVVDFVGQGIHLWGQKTLQRRATARQSVNVRRMLLTAKKAVAAVCRSLTFEQNDQALWDEFTALVRPYFENLKLERGLYDFRVVADASTTTPLKIDNAIMNGRILLKPTRAAEVIEVDFVILSTGAEFAEVA